MKLASILPIAWVIGWALAVLLSSGRANNSVVLAWLALILAGSGFLIGLYVFSQGFRVLRRKQQIANTPLSKIASAAMGPVEIYGRVTGPYTLLSPLAETDCYYYRTVAWGAQDLQGHPAERVTESLYTPFYLEDETGRLMIDPRGAGLDLPAAYEEEIRGEKHRSMCATLSQSSRAVPAGHYQNPRIRDSARRLPLRSRTSPRQSRLDQHG